ncbi:essential Ser/Thr kinase [Western grey kangaroopox virus]|uniref:Serine/threonine-protein kinase n=1 Tax=Western grey kangaroopox virus TaxID=1566307 RepID=A0A2C9DSH5_9POXV|nr:essential Ser/Thr kinase [Western grey kangaroopox virus]ATI20958.1 essential Ser/Thr kinase [Western grey kangaroopox virus]
MEFTSGTEEETVVSRGRTETTILGDEIYFNYVYGHLEPNQNWLPSFKLLRYFRKFTRESLDKIASGSYINPSYFQLRDQRFAETNNDFYHLSTGGYGIVFKVEEYVVKFVFEANRNLHPMDLTSEYTLPRFLHNNLTGDERLLIVRALAMGLNFRIGFLYRIYKRALYTILLLHKIYEGQPLTLDYTHRRIVNIFNQRKTDARFVKLLSYFYPAVVKSNINVINHFNYMVNFFENDKRAHQTFDRGNVIIFPLAKFSAEKINRENCGEYGFDSVVTYVKFMFLQMALLYVKIYELPCHNFIHLDLKPDNILIFDSDRPLVIHVGTLTYVFEERIRCTLNDFDFSQVSEIPNKKTRTTVNVEHNWFYDFHFFVHTILRIYPEVEADEQFAGTLHEFVMLCNRSTCEKSRLQIKRLHSISFLAKVAARNIFSRWINDDTDGRQPL